MAGVFIFIPTNSLGLRIPLMIPHWLGSTNLSDTELEDKSLTFCVSDTSLVVLEGLSSRTTNQIGIWPFTNIFSTSSSSNMIF